MKLATIKEVSAFLKVKESTLYAWVNQKTIPAFKLQGLWRFDMNAIEKWVKDSHNTKTIPKKIIKKTIQKQDIDRIIQHIIEETHGNK